MKFVFFAIAIFSTNLFVHAAFAQCTIPDHLTIGAQHVQIVPGSCELDSEWEKQWSGCHVVMYRYNCKRPNDKGHVTAVAIGNADDPRHDWKCHAIEDRSGFTDINEAQHCLDVVNNNVRDWSKMVYQNNPGIPGMVTRDVTAARNANQQAQDLNP